MKKLQQNHATLIQNKYYLFNNLWGADTGSGSQCTWSAASEKSPMAWGTQWNWDGPEHTIKSYAAMVWGWHWGWKVSNCGLPVQLSSLKSLCSTWEFELTHTIPGGTNVTYDIWLSDNPQADNENPTGEVMVWLYKIGEITPIGSEVDRVMIEGVQWRLWKGAHPVSGWPVYSFIREENTNRQTLDLVHFFQHLAAFGLSQSNYLLGVQAGPEIFTGKGSLDTLYYDMSLQQKEWTKRVEN